MHGYGHLKKPKRLTFAISTVKIKCSLNDWTAVKRVLCMLVIAVGMLASMCLLLKIVCVCTCAHVCVHVSACICLSARHSTHMEGRGQLCCWFSPFTLFEICVPCSLMCMSDYATHEWLWWLLLTPPPISLQRCCDRRCTWPHLASHGFWESKVRWSHLHCKYIH